MTAHGHTHEHVHREHVHSHGEPESGHTPEHSHQHHGSVEQSCPAHNHEHAASASGFQANPNFANLREDLPEGFGNRRVLFLDCASGIAGDMTIAALVNLGVPWTVIEGNIAKLGLSGFRLELLHGRVGAIGASRFEVHIDAHHHERHYGEICDLIRSSDLQPDVSELALRIFHRLALAEAKVHQIPIEKVHFHEVGAIDAIVDIVGAAAALVHLGAEVVASPLPLGHGFVTCRHGVIPLPAPATVECLCGVPTYSAGIEAETVTPTGAAIVGAACCRFSRWPQMVPERIGWGAGTLVLPDRPNALRVVLGMPFEGSNQADAGHAILEANIDDMTGELAGHVISLLMHSGALDAWATPITMKKGRPGVVLSAIVAPGDSQRFSELILRETTTIGVRRTVADRVERPRRMIEVQTRFGAVPVKVAEGPYGPPQFKPEFDVCAKLAEQHEVPVREVLTEALIKARGA
jgi:pyridinium-3,5-bisthiocarboxylic acid mononucleotide nickel chelatase